jgi:hypothetical protein
MIQITQIPDLNEDDLATLKRMYCSEIFLIVLKLIKKEYFAACSKMEDCGPHELSNFQGTARGLKQVYNLIMHYTVPEASANEKKPVGGLINGKRVANFKG